MTRHHPFPAVVMSLFFSFTTSQAEVTSGGNNSSSPPDQRIVEAYKKEAECAVQNGSSEGKKVSDEKQLNRARHFALTLAQTVGNWNPPMPASWRQHMYAQFDPEVSLFAINRESEKNESKIPSGNEYRGSGWIQLTHKENYAKFNCFKQKWLQNGRRIASLEEAKQLSQASQQDCPDREQIVSNPDHAFKYDDGAAAQAVSYNGNGMLNEQNVNNDLPALWYFFMQLKNNKFEQALQSVNDESVKVVRRAVNRGDPNSTSPGVHEDKAIKSAQATTRSHCFPDAAMVAGY